MSSDRPSLAKIFGGHLAAGLVLGTLFGLAYFFLEPLLDFRGRYSLLGVPLVQLLGAYLLSGMALGGLLGLLAATAGVLLRRWSHPAGYVVFHVTALACSLALILQLRNYTMQELKALPTSINGVAPLLTVLILVAAGFLIARFVRRRGFRGIRSRAVVFLTVACIIAVIAIKSIGTFWANQIPKRSSAAANSPNVVFIVLDALRLDHMSAYGYHRETTPNMKRLAEEGVIFQYAHSHGRCTFLAMPALFTSLYPSFHGVMSSRSFKRPLSESRTTIAEVLQEAGYTTIGLITNIYLMDVFGMTQGFDYIEEFRRGRYQLGLYKVFHHLGIVERPTASLSPYAPEVTDRALHWLRKAKDRPFFLYIHYMDTHHPYKPHSPYDTLFGDGGATPTPQKLFEKTITLLNNSMKGNLTASELQKLVDYYDGSIRLVDAEIGRIVDEMQRLSKERETIIIITADHGDEFLEHGYIYHNNLVFEELIHVPLIIWDSKRRFQAKEIEPLVRHVDILPTIAELAHADIPSEAMGISLIPLMTGETDSFDITSIAEGEECTSLIYGHWKIMKVDSTDSFHLFNLKLDPREEKDLSEVNPIVFKEMRDRLDAYMKSTEGIVHKHEVELDEEKIKRLKALGYL